MARVYSYEDRLKIKELLDQGRTKRSVAMELGKDVTGFYRHVASIKEKNNGSYVAYRPYQPLYLELKEKAKALLEEGFTRRDIAKDVFIFSQV